MTAAASLDIDDLRRWIGRREEASERATADIVRRFRATFDDDPSDVALGAAAPRMLHWCLAQPAVQTRALGPDGHPARGGFLPPVPLPRRMWAGGSLAFTGDIAVEDEVRRVSTVTDVQVKHGRSGSLCFVAVGHEIWSGERLVISEVQDIVYRAAGRTATPAPGIAPAPEGRHRRPADTSAPMLFRYSALTFNGHRIHYDHPYVTQVEGYPGLVVHGPLQATWLLRFATDIHGTPPACFTFRGHSPVFDDAPLMLHAEETAEGLNLWTARPGGPVAMSAEATW